MGIGKEKQLIELKFPLNNKLKLQLQLQQNNGLKSLFRAF